MDAETALPVEMARFDEVAVITLNRPDRLNALSHALMERLREAVAAAGADTGVRCLVLTGSGRAFSAGADLKDGPSDAAAVLRTYYNPLIRELFDLDKPVVAAVNGPAAGAGASLALACDLRVAAQSATFDMAFARVGLIPDAGATWLLPRIVGAGRAAEMTLLGRRVPATEALQWGLVGSLVPDAELLPSALELATALARLPRTARSTRALLQQGWTRDLSDHLEAEATAQGEAQLSAEHAEALRAFREKRTPRYTGVNDR